MSQKGQQNYELYLFMCRQSAGGKLMSRVFIWTSLKCASANDSELMRAAEAETRSWFTLQRQKHSFSWHCAPSPGAYVTSTAAGTTRTRCVPPTGTPTTTPVWSERRRVWSRSRSTSNTWAGAPVSVGGRFKAPRAALWWHSVKLWSQWEWLFCEQGAVHSESCDEGSLDVC